jgi:hypothetical protein
MSGYDFICYEFCAMDCQIDRVLLGVLYQFDGLQINKNSTFFQLFNNYQFNFLNQQVSGEIVC